MVVVKSVTLLNVAESKPPALNFIGIVSEFTECPQKRDFFELNLF